MMEEYRYITLMEKPELKEEAAYWFQSKWGIPKEVYLECMCCLYRRGLPLQGDRR